MLCVRIDPSSAGQGAAVSVSGYGNTLPWVVAVGPDGNCASTDYVLVSQAEYSGFTAGLGTASVFNIPDSSTLGAAWMAGFALPMICHLVAYSVGRLVSMFNSQ